MSDDQPIDRDTTADEKSLDDAKTEWQMSSDATVDQRSNEIKDLRFEAGEHWAPEYLEWRKDKQQPAFTMDQMSGPIAKITNSPVQRIVVRPDAGGSDPKAAAYWQGICRRIERLSGAEQVYAWARMHATKMGRGFWKVRHDFYMQMEKRADGVYDAGVFQQDIRVEPFLNQHAVYEDPRCQTLDFSDARFGIACDDIHWSVLKRLHPNATLASYEGMRAAGDCPPQWGSEKFARVAERYWIEDIKIPLCLLVDGRVVPKGSGYSREQIRLEHEFVVPQVWWMKFTWGEVLEAPKPVAGRYIPIVKIVGERRIVEGKDDCRGIVRMGKEPQRLVDFMESKLAEIVDIATWQTIMAEFSTIAHDQDAWNRINQDRPAVVTWKANQDSTGAPLPPPSVLSGRPDVAAVALAAQRASMQLRHALGVPDVTPEETRPEQSGVAIGKRMQEQAQATSHFADSTGPGIAYTGRIIHAMARSIYDVPRVLRIIGDEEKEIEIVTHKGADQRGPAQAMAGSDPSTGEAVRKMFDISAGEFDFGFEAGRGYHNGREETVDILQNAVPHMPPPMQEKAWPILIKNMDAPGMQELSKAIEPPDPKSGMVPVAEAQKAQMVIDQLTQAVGELQQQIDQNQQELDSKERIAAADNQTKKAIADGQLQLAAQKAELDFALEQQKVQADVEKARISADADAKARVQGFAHERGMASHNAALAPPPNDGGPA